MVSNRDNFSSTVWARPKADQSVAVTSTRSKSEPIAQKRRWSTEGGAGSGFFIHISRSPFFHGLNIDWEYHFFSLHRIERSHDFMHFCSLALPFSQLHRFQRVKMDETVHTKQYWRKHEWFSTVNSVSKLNEKLSHPTEFSSWFPLAASSLLFADVETLRACLQNLWAKYTLPYHKSLSGICSVRSVVQSSMFWLYFRLKLVQ